MKTDIENITAFLACNIECSIFEKHVAPVIANYQAQPSIGVADGWKLVPIEPTEAMHDAGVDADDSDFERGVGANVSTIYRAMLAASPSAQIAEGSDDA